MGSDDLTDDPTIQDDERLLRRIPLKPSHVKNDPSIGGVRPTSVAFADEQLSVDLESVLLANGKTTAAALDGYSDCALVAITAGAVRQQGQIIVRTPQPHNAAHADVVGPKNKQVQRTLAKAASWVVRPPDC